MPHLVLTSVMYVHLQVQDLRVEVQNIKAGLHATTRYIQEPKQLKESIKELYRKYLRDFEQARAYARVHSATHILSHRTPSSWSAGLPGGPNC